MGDQQNQGIVANISSESRIDFKLHILEKNNYTIWKAHTRNVLEAKGLMAAIESELLNSSRERQCRAILTSALSNDNQMKVINCNSSFKIWKRLEAIYENKSSFERENLLNKLHSYKIASSKEIAGAIGEMETIAAKLKLLGENISDESLMSAILRALPKQFSTFISIWRGTAAAERTIDNLLTRIMAEAEDGNRSGDEDAAADKALYSRQLKPKPKTKTQFRSRRSRANDTCHNCGKPGHWKRDCPEDEDDEESDDDSPMGRTLHARFRSL